MTKQRKHLAPRPSRERFAPQPTFRPEIQGLRSLAVLLVVTYHIWFGRVSGGVDVFLFISAFLLSLSSLRKIHDGKPLNILKYWLHVFQRLLPAALTVILATLLASPIILPFSRHAATIQDAKASLLYYLNWHLANNSVDYYAQNATVKTPFQHFWSLSMQGQIFILWPLLFGIVALIVWNLRTKVTGTALLIFGSIFVASLTFSIIETSTNQAYAYFDTRTRLWEFAAGTLLAILLLKWQAPHKARVIMGWTGIIGLITCGWLLPVATGFPGYLALWPLTSAALVISAGQTGSPLGADRLLSAKPLQKMGAISYCLYLVHWPLLILYTTATGREQAGWIDGGIIIAASIALAWVLHTLVEKPLRALEKKPSRAHLARSTKNPPAGKLTTNTLTRPIATIAILLTIGALPISAAQAWTNHKQHTYEQLANAAGTPDFPGAQSITHGEKNRYRYPAIPATDPIQQFDGLSRPCDTTGILYTPELNENCTHDIWGTPNSPTTYIIGDSHAEQAISVFRPIAQDTNTNMVAILMGGCRFTTYQYENRDDCNTFNRNVLNELLTATPENVLLITTAAHPATNAEVRIPGIENTIETLTNAGINVIGLRDNPRYTYNVYECAQINEHNHQECSAPVEEKLAPANPVDDFPLIYDNFYGVDLTDYYCPNGTCQSVIGNVYLYIDDNHISKAYGTTLAPHMREQLEEQELPLVTS